MMQHNSIFLVAVMSIFLSACNSTNVTNGDAAGTRHVSEGAGDWTDTPSNATPPVLDGPSTVREGVSDCSQDKNYIYGTNQGCDFSIEAFKSGAVQKLKCVDEDVYVNDVLMNNVKLGSLMLVCK